MWLLNKLGYLDGIKAELSIYDEYKYLNRQWRRAKGVYTGLKSVMSFKVLYKLLKDFLYHLIRHRGLNARESLIWRNVNRVSLLREARVMTEAENDKFIEKEMEILQNKGVHKEITIPEGVQKMVVRNFLVGWKSRGKLKRNLINRILWGVSKAKPRHDIYHDQNVGNSKHKSMDHVPRMDDIYPPEDMDSHGDGLSEILSQDSDLSNVNVLSDGAILKRNENANMKKIAEKYFSDPKDGNVIDNDGKYLSAAKQAFRKFMSSSNTNNNIDSNNSSSSSGFIHANYDYNDNEQGHVGITAEMIGPQWKEVVKKE